jgi:hypothetical protein
VRRDMKEKEKRLWRILDSEYICRVHFAREGMQVHDTPMHIST